MEAAARAFMGPAPAKPARPNGRHEARRPLVVEPAGRFLAQAGNAPIWLITDLVAFGGITMLHGRPRSMKSLTALELAVGATLGRPGFGAERFAVERALRVAYMTEEDSAALVSARLRWLLAGHKAAPPDTLWLSARKGLSLEEAASQAQIHDAVTSLALDLAIIDTGRAFAPSVDKGPSDAAGPIRFLRSILSETCLSGVVVVHHDTKPGRDGQDARARSDRASGGALLAAADCPIGFERLSDRATLAVPDRFKVSADPQPFRLTFTSASDPGESFKDWVVVAASASDERHEAEEKVTTSVATVLEQADEWLSGSAIAERAGGRRQDVFTALRTLAEAGRVNVRDGKRGAKEYRHGIA